MRNTVTIFVFILAALYQATPAAAQTTCPSNVAMQWLYGSNCYTTQAAAVAAIQSTPGHPEYSVLTVVGKPNAMAANSASYTLTAPPLDEIYQGWTYGWSDPVSEPSEAAAVAAMLQNTVNPACGAGSVTPAGAWNDPNAGPDLYEQRMYQVVYSAGGNNGVPCGFSSPHNFNMIRRRAGACPQYYYQGSSTFPYCLGQANQILKSLTLEKSNPSSEMGDPVDAASGDFSQTEMDYSSPTLSFTRYYHSASLESFHNLGIGWTHQYAASLVLNVGGVPVGLLRPDGHNDPLWQEPNVAIYESLSGDGIHVQASSPNWTAYLPDGSKEIYNASGVLIQLVSPGGAITVLNYVNGLLSSVVGPFGHKLTFSYNSSNNIGTVADLSGNTISYSYDVLGNLNGVLYPDGKSRTYLYQNATLRHNITGVLDESGTQYSTIAYDGNGRAASSQNATGANAISILYGTTSATVTDGLGSSTVFGFEVPSGSASRVTSKAHNSLTTTYIYPTTGIDQQQRPIQMTDPNGNITKYSYDNDHLTSRTEAYGTAQARTTSYQYLSTLTALPTLVVEPLKQTAYTYYPATNNIQTKTVTDTTVTPNVSRVWTYTYNSFGQALTVDGPRTDASDVTTYTYFACTAGYQCGQIDTITDALGHITTFNSYNVQGQPLTITDPNGIVTTLTYDQRLRLLSRQVGSETTSYSYYPTGLQQTVTLPDTSTITYGYDAAHRLTDITDGLGDHTHYTLDNMGNRTAESTYDPSSALKRTHTRVINALNEISQEVNAAGTTAVTTTLTYDNNGNVTGSAAPLARDTANQYDALNRLQQITDPNAGVAQFTYDANDNLATVKDPRNLITSYTRNGFGDVTQLVSPDTGTSLSTYDSGGNLKTTTDARSALATYSYDALNRVSQVAYSDQTINFSYDSGSNGVGRLTGASDANHSMSWSYDTHGRVTGKGQTIGTLTKSVGYSYTNGDLTSVVTPSGQTIAYGYTNHRITLITVNGTTILSAATYDPFGPATSWTWGNATTMSRTFDEDGNPAHIVTAAVTNTYTVDNASRITAISDSGLVSNSWTFGYDLLDRVNSGTSTASTRGYTYDTNSNRLTTTGTTASTETIVAASNRLSSTTGGIVRTYTYDAAGNTQGYASNSYTFNQRGRMSQATVSGAATNYVYNALGQLIEKSGNGGTTLLMYDEAGHILGEYTGSGALIQETVWMGGTPVATLLPNGSSIANYYVHTDHLGTPRKITRPSDNGLMWRWDPDSFGSVAPNSNPAGLGTFVYNLRFPGQYYQAETGLNYNYYRDYDPLTGRYIESDPIGLYGGNYSTYAYVGGNPLSYIDPTGQTGVSNTIYFFEWFFGLGPSHRTYGPNRIQTQEMEDSVAAQQMRDAFYKAGCKNVRNLAYGTFQAYLDTTANPYTADWGSTAFEVGGFAGGSVTNNGDGTATYSFPNVSGTHSFWFHLVPDRTSQTGMMRNITQVFTWTEPSGCGCQQ